jgi:acyl-CoA synthetase (AMP-forming)/AMP-acid ligase II
MPNRVLNYFREHFPQTSFVNLYGPTETTFNCAYYKVERAFSDTDDLPIGIPFPNTDILLLDQNNQPVEQGEIGEICVRGSALAMGYYNDLEATGNAFVQNPLNDHYPEFIYKTGDLGKMNDLGELMFISRMDQQIKHMGYRIELGEIEAVINSLPFIEKAACINDADHQKIVLFYQAPERCDKKILTGLHNRLPKHMTPNILIHRKELPLKSNLKVDRTKLQRLYFDEFG